MPSPKHRGKRMVLRDRTAVVTGAASGLGRALALALARRGTHLALVDRDERGLAETAGLVGEPIRISTHRIDLADSKAVRDTPGHVLAEHGGLDLLFNNAGVALGGRFEQISDDEFDWLFNVNFWGMLRMTRAFLPSLRCSGDARIVNLASVYGLIAPAGQTAYAASKFAVRGFSMSLAAELADSSVGVTLVYPGGIVTQIAASARMAASLSPQDAIRVRAHSSKYLKLPPEHAAEIIIRAVERRRPRVVVGRDAQFLSLLERLLPGLHGRVVTRLGMDG